MIGAPSNGILTEKICWSLMVVDRDVRTVLGSAELKAESASLTVVSRLVRPSASWEGGLTGSWDLA